MKSKILIADPDAPFVAVACRILGARLGVEYDVLGTCDGEEAYAFVDREAPAVAALGSGLPGRSAVDIAGAFRGRGRRGDCRFVALIAPGREDEGRAVMEAGACSYLVKPFTAGALATHLLEVGTLGVEARGERTFVILLATCGGHASLKADLARHGGAPVVVAEDVEVALALARSPRCLALFAAEPIPGFSAPALSEYLRAERVRVPLVRIGPGTSRHAKVPSLAPRFGPAELLAVLSTLKRDDEDRPVVAAARKVDKCYIGF
jgi:CheY-like chemotaxis protein